MLTITSKIVIPLMLLMTFFLLFFWTSLSLFFVNTLARTGEYSFLKNIQYGKHQKALDIYVPLNKVGRRLNPTIVFFYGGCWGACKTFEKKHYRFVAEALTKQGYQVVIPDYRRYPEVTFPQIIDDVRESVEWVHANIGDYFGDGEKIYLMGHSAGAHLASMLTFNKKYLTAETYQAVRGFIGLAGPYDFFPFTEDYQPYVFAPPSHYPDSQPINFVSGGEPPILLLYGLKDKTVQPRNSRHLTQKILNVDGRVTAKEYQDLNHSGLIAALSIPLRNRYPVLNDILHFLKETEK